MKKLRLSRKQKIAEVAQDYRHIVIFPFGTIGRRVLNDLMAADLSAGTNTRFHLVDANFKKSDRSGDAELGTSNDGQVRRHARFEDVFKELRREEGILFVLASAMHGSETLRKCESLWGNSRVAIIDYPELARVDRGVYANREYAVPAINRPFLRTLLSLTALHRLSADMTSYIQVLRREMFWVSRKRCLLSSLPLAEMYFDSQVINPDAFKIFVDVGAYDGDTMGAALDCRSEYIETYIAIEPSPGSYVALRQSVGMRGSQVDIQTINAVVAEESGVDYDIEELGIASYPVRRPSFDSDSGDLNPSNKTVRSTTLDDLATTLGLEPTFVKLDVEGYELSVLLGSRDLINRNRCIFAISCYHSRTQLAEVLHFCRTELPSFSARLRKYGSEVDNLVLYLIPS